MKLEDYLRGWRRRKAQEENPPEDPRPRPSIAAMLGDPRGTNFDDDGQPPTGGMRPPR